MKKFYLVALKLKLLKVCKTNKQKFCRWFFDSQQIKKEKKKESLLTIFSK